MPPDVAPSLETAGRLYLRRGSRPYRQASLALFAAGFATFALLYCVQPLMPLYSAAFGVRPAVSSLALSLSTGLLAVAMLLAGIASELLGRKPPMLVSLGAAAALTLLAAAAPGWPSLLALRALEGVALSGVPAIAMAYLAEEVEPDSLGAAMGLYIGGTAVGGMSGRLVTGVVVDLSGSWRVAMATIGVLGLLAALAFWRLLPPSQGFTPARRTHVRHHGLAYLRHLGDPGLRWLYLAAFLLMGGFVTVYNYAGYRLTAPPFGLSQAAVGAIFLVYLLGTPASTLFGGLAARAGRGTMLACAALLMAAGLALTLRDELWVVIAGIAVFTTGFFGGHTVASSWVGQRAREGRAQAASLYLFCYYAGSALVGSYGGRFWTADGWAGVAALVGVLLAAMLAVALRLALLRPAPARPLRS